MLFRGKALYFLIIVAALYTACRSESQKPEEKLQYYGNGEVSRRHYEVNGKKEGIMTDYYPDGKKRGERIFRNDLQSGRSVFYYPDGQIKEVQYFSEEGLKEGGDTVFYDTGGPQFLVTFKNGVKHGYVRKWSPEGELTYEARYEMDTLVEVKGKLLDRHGTGS